MFILPNGKELIKVSTEQRTELPCQRRRVERVEYYTRIYN